jgi:hypothetical protein
VTPRLFVNTYRPLALTRSGMDVARRESLPPFVDSSIRREPDLEHEWPAISCLCRAGKFAPRLAVGDIVVYLTVKARYRSKRSHRRLTAVLRVVQRFSTHREAARWYRSRRQRLPSNCIACGNPPLPLTQTALRGAGCAAAEQLERCYCARSREHGDFLACEPLYRELSFDAPVVHDSDLKHVFGKVPGTQNPAPFPVELLRRLARRLGLRALPSVP